MSPAVTSILDPAGEALGGFLPRVGGALVLLVVGILLVRLFARLVERALYGAGLDRAVDRWGVHDVLERAGLGRSLSHVLGVALRVGLTLVVVFAALSLLGLQFLSESLNAAVLFLPKLLAAAGLLLAGVVLGALVRERLERASFQMDLPVPLGRIAQIAVVSIFVITAAAQIAVSTAILMLLIGILLAAAAGTVALAFGLGGREVAREISAGRYLRDAYTPGQRIRVGEVEGEIVGVETAMTILRTETGDTVRVPNNTLLGSVVTVRGDSAAGSR
ncbi:MAG TPA: mechanosensitive ion channel domain-containing protein [Thermoleophilaceae bacterium]|nr:mechanosensitive ion channel domain-containing protein [Thermoleophilaceae bacterium]